MPITDYSKTIIYVIKCIDDTITEEYVGSTTNFRSRKSGHKSRCSKDYNFKIYEFIRANGGWDNWIMIQLEEYPCKNKREAECREEQIRQDRKATLNSQRAFLTAEQTAEYMRKKANEYYKEHTEQMAEKAKEYRKENTEQLAEYQKDYYKKNTEKLKEKVKKYSKEHSEQIAKQRKEYYEKNKEQIKEKRKKYYKQNTKQIEERRREYRKKKKEQKQAEQEII
jgi:hypothetical protein